jgi:hypothetical protein
MLALATSILPTCQHDHRLTPSRITASPLKVGWPMFDPIFNLCSRRTFSPGSRRCRWMRGERFPGTRRRGRRARSRSGISTRRSNLRRWLRPTGVRLYAQLILNGDHVYILSPIHIQGMSQKNNGVAGESEDLVVWDGQGGTGGERGWDGGCIFSKLISMSFTGGMQGCRDD